ncbi:hypothetical protein C5167_005976 [Papaver somniferum]|uniref:Uncharacterized protein n=1 Tax=Papaver somniferum TaxID=3469 RepID=A0A4Y7JFU9_PAPSO|nr:hypothetical protein C5167_005976 [Papaver somniferum]
MMLLMLDGFINELECIHAGLASVLDADAKRIATMSRETFEKDGPLLVVASGQDTISVAVFVNYARSGHGTVYKLVKSSACSLLHSVFTRVDFSAPESELAANVVKVCTHFHYVCNYQIQHPRMNLSRFDVVITPRHDYYPLTPQVQVQIPKFFREWVTPYEPPNKNVLIGSGQNVLASCGSLRISFSRRTPQKKQLSVHKKPFAEHYGACGLE